MNEAPLAPVDYGKFHLSLKRLDEQHANYQSADVRRAQLDQEAVAESVIQRFETCYDCLWKVLRRHLIYVLGVPDVPNSPNPIFRLAAQNRLFRAPLDQWLLYAQKRIDTTHDGHRGLLRRLSRHWICLSSDQLPKRLVRPSSTV